MNITITKAPVNHPKKMVAIVNDKKIYFGQKGYEDYTIHKNEKRKQRYIDRHENNEDWTKTGLNKPGFYSRHVLWSEPTLKQSIDKLNNKYKDIKFSLK